MRPSGLVLLLANAVAEATWDEQQGMSNVTSDESRMQAMFSLRESYGNTRAYIAPALCVPGSDPCKPVQPGALGKVLHAVRDGSSILRVSVADSGTVKDGSKPHLVQLRFETLETLRLQVAPWSAALSPESRVVDAPYASESVATDFKQAGDGSFIYSSGGLAVHGHGNPFRLKVLRDGKEVFRLENPVSWNESMTTLSVRGAGSEGREWWYGGGMQNGYAQHTGRRIGIWEGGPHVWDKGGHANPVPFAMSSQGYGFFRNTFAPGEYSFPTGGGAAMAHAELGLDAYIFLPKSGDMKGVLGRFVEVQGRPVVPPVWALSLGDSDCYNNERHGFDTNSSLPIAKSYAASDLPTGWMMVNDGYGCGYSTKSSLMRTRRELKERGLRMGLWTEKGLEDAPWEIGTAGSRVIKTDVKWVGHGYKFGVDAVKTAAQLMQQYGVVEDVPGATMTGNGRESARPFTWTVCGWASTSAYAVVWTGDSMGNWPYIRMQVPSVIGSGLSGQHLASGDVDGIYGGSPETYVRDLQWKTFLPVSMTMSGWSPQVAGNQKQPWAFGEPYTSHNRAALRLRHALTPYMYSLVVEGHRTGVPPVRSIGLEFPGCLSTLGGVDDQFLSGPFLFVAPVLGAGSARTGLQLPGACAGHGWFDFWTGKELKHPFPTSFPLDSLEQLPVYVRAGAVLPILDAAGPALRAGGWGPELRLEVFVPSEPASSSFTLYEDDGDSMAYASGEQAEQRLSLHREANGWRLEIGASEGAFAGKHAERAYAVRIYGVRQQPLYLGGEKLPDCASGSARPCVRWLSADDAYAPTRADRLGGLGALPSLVLETGPRSLAEPVVLGSIPPSASPVTLPAKVHVHAQPKVRTPLPLPERKLPERKMPERIMPERQLTVSINGPDGAVSKVAQAPADRTLARKGPPLPGHRENHPNQLLGQTEPAYWGKLLGFSLLVVGAAAAIWYGTAVVAQRRRKVLEQVMQRSREFAIARP